MHEHVIYYDLLLILQSLRLSVFVNKELYNLLDCRDLKQMPLLVLANKMDKEDHMADTEIVERMNLDYIDDHKWKILPISALHGTNMEQAVEWILEAGKEAKEYAKK